MRGAAYQRKAFQFDGSPGIHTLLGPRRIGKSTQFKLWIQEILALKHGFPFEVFYLDAERFETWKELLAVLERQDKPRFVFIDEITAALDWTRALKIMVGDGLECI